LVLIQVCVGLFNRQIAHQFQHSGEMSHIVREICAVMRSVNHLFMVVPDATTPVEARIAESNKYYPYFRECIGCWDGTFVPAHLTGEDLTGGSFRDRS
jgi:hypothetical protein